MVPLFEALVRPILEYANYVVWNTHLRKRIDDIEKVQRKLNKFISEVRFLEYEDRLTALKLHSLEHRRLRGDIIEMYIITHNIYDP